MTVLSAIQWLSNVSGVVRNRKLNKNNCNRNWNNTNNNNRVCGFKHCMNIRKKSESSFFCLFSL